MTCLPFLFPYRYVCQPSQASIGPLHLIHADADAELGGLPGCSRRRREAPRQPGTASTAPPGIIEVLSPLSSSTVVSELLRLSPFPSSRTGPLRLCPSQSVVRCRVAAGTSCGGREGQAAQRNQIRWSSSD
ncbi:unnamed protein product [Urochloa humidicola]